MIVKKTSWHYSIHRFCENTFNMGISNNLCLYFWATIGKIALTPILLIVGLAFLIVGGPIYGAVKGAEFVFNGVDKVIKLDVIKQFIATYFYALLYGVCAISVGVVFTIFGFYVFPGGDPCLFGEIGVSIFVSIFVVLLITMVGHGVFEESDFKDKWKKEKKKDLLTEYSSAVKNKMCPLIEFED